MIKSFRHKGLSRFFEAGIAKGVQPRHSARLRMLLAALETAHDVSDMEVPGFGLHALKGNQKGRWAVSVSGNWRMTFEFKDGNSYHVDYEDYH
ncbi:MAG TPA: type II toxin-antitoxin system RelE/ParE family toxin [Gammaproteobacteria bacterium]